MVDGRDASTANAVATNFRGLGHGHGAAEQAHMLRLALHFSRAPQARRASCLCAALILALGAACLSFVGSAAASGVERSHLLALRGIARIDAHVARSHGKLVLSGTVTDDIGAPTPHVRVTVQIATEPAGSAPSTPSALAPMAPEPCSDAWPVPALERADRLAVDTDSAARFCVRLALPPGRLFAHIEANGSGFVDGARIDLPVDMALQPVTLRFDPEREVVSLDEASTAIDVVATTEDDGLTSAAPRLPLTLSSESGGALGSATTNAAGRARFVVPGALFGAPGKGELRVSFAGSAQAGATSYAASVERRTHVELEGPESAGGRLPLASSEREVALHVVARATCPSCGRSGAPTGTIEVRVGDGDASRLAGAAPLAQGEARVVVTFATPSEGEGAAPVRLDYVPDAPWFEAAGPLRLIQPLHPPSGLDQALLALTGAGVFVWLAAGRLPRHASAKERSPGGLPIPESAAGVELLRADGSGARAWNGRVVDGHEGTAIAGARIALERPGFERVEVVAEASSDADGVFALSPAEVRPGDRLVAEGLLHGVHRVPAPPFGEVRVALVSRRRALLDRLVGWARRKGRPYDAHPEPTPGHVQRMARPGDAARAWAEAVERAAYSGAPIDAQGEAEVDRLAPVEAVPVPPPDKT
jgi:hypothetical protein